MVPWQTAWGLVRLKFSEEVVNPDGWVAFRGAAEAAQGCFLDARLEATGHGRASLNVVVYTSCSFVGCRVYFLGVEWA
jgi:hypothetical protein